MAIFHVARTSSGTWQVLTPGEKRGPLFISLEEAQRWAVSLAEQCAPAHIRIHDGRSQANIVTVAAARPRPQEQDRPQPERSEAKQAGGKQAMTDAQADKMINLLHAIEHRLKEVEGLKQQLEQIRDKLWSIDYHVDKIAFKAEYG
jgi:hypothetical protein